MKEENHDYGSYGEEDSEDKKEEEKKEEEFKEKVIYYRGTCYPSRGKFNGTWGTTPDEIKG